MDWFNAMKEIRAARMHLLQNQPFFGTLAMYLEVVEEPYLNFIAATDGQKIYVNPGRIKAIGSTRVVQTVVAHEVMHCALSHFCRLGSKDKELWNIAGDHVINLILKEAGFEVPSWCLCNDRYTGWTTEQVYADLLKDPAAAKAGAGESILFGGVIQPNGDGCESADTTATVHLSGEWKQRIASAADAARRRGNLPQGLERYVTAELYPKVHWKDALASLVKQVCREDYSWSRPSRRHVSRGEYLPALYAHKVGPIVIGVDTSGSIGDKEVSQFAAEISDILSEVKPEIVHVVYCDAKVARVETFSTQDLPIVLHPKGGGGTDFAPVFKWIDDNSISPEALVYLTDTHGSCTIEQPSYPVIWASIVQDITEPPFGEVIYID